MPTALQGFRENNRERRGVGPPCQHSRAFSASGKGLKRWPLILSPTLRSALLRASQRTATSETEPAAILRDARRAKQRAELLRMRPSRRRFAPPQDEVCWFKLHPPDPIGFMESIYSSSSRTR